MRALLFLAAIVGFAVACSSSGADEKTSDSAAVCKPKPLNPNGDSELAILMREMATWTDSCKAALLSGRTVPEKPKSVEALHTAKRTDETIDASLFNSMATLYEGQVVNFEQADAANKIRMYNGMVSACAGCHQNFCQGPLVRINKMMIAQ
jgi:hypothetical protein